ncbi:MAG TPA: 16S rRNA (guanine(966)-N(2))-methyltransferase RsmD [Allosphingosinicella sp.]|jgi:16S rRNA (guanine966-N2)-methyltransferase|nr:16S rRNA (guanine(966)-N(2))-methyltransferase RsmD [Allosphingosinicella sp.]
MRIVAGRWRGRPLVAPQGQDTRPTSDRVREALFSMLASRLGTFEGLRVADLFAGTGALGLEALSRGAARCTFIERERAALAAIERNVASLGAGPLSEIRAGAVERAPAPREPFHLVFMDPPYGQDLAQAALDRIVRDSWVDEGGWISIEKGPEPLQLPGGLALDSERRFGKARLLLVRRSDS